MDWKKNDTLPLDAKQQIIIASKEEGSDIYRYNVVFYYEPMGVWYGGPGIKVSREDIEWWSEVPPPP